MTTEQSTKLRSLFKVIFASKINADKYGQVSSLEELESLLENNPEDKKMVEETLDNYSDIELEAMAEELNASVESENQPIMAAKGAKIDYLSTLRKLKKGGKAKKCKCGCDIVEVQERGGKLISKCSCGCDVKTKKQVPKAKIDPEKLATVSKFKKYKK
jgi:hypothetical protein